MFDKKEQRAVDTIRALSVEMINKANSGHPGLPLGAAPMTYALFSEHLEVNPEVSDWVDRDRFVLSAGHGSALLYSVLHLAGFDVSMDDLKNFRQLGSKTPGHPEVTDTDGVEATTGPLGQGFAMAVGMAAAEEHLAATYNTDKHTVVDHYTYTLVGDGCLMEGISYEAASYAGRQELDKLIVLYDSNDISLDGDLDMSFNEDIKARFEAQNWHYLRVEDGNDLQAISDAISEAKAHKGQPTIIEIKTVIGYGAPKEGTNAVHGAPLGEEDWAKTRTAYGINEDEYEPFTVPADVQEVCDGKIKNRGQKAYNEWLEKFEAYKKDEPELASQFEQAFKGELPADYDSGLEFLTEGSDATRNSSKRAIQALAEKVPYLWGGSADLSSSNNTMIASEEGFFPESRDGRNIWFGVREFAMAAIVNGIMLHGGTKAYCATFFVFSDYMRGAIRMAALSEIPSIFVTTHDSIAVGEDGPTHEPIEHLASFRTMPNVNMMRPADENETYVAWKVALESTDRPTILALTRQPLPVLNGSAELAEEGVRKGGYVISPSQNETPEGILIATGSEVSLAIEVQEGLAEEGIDVSVVSMPATNLFDEQSAEYKESVLPSNVRNRMSIEMGSSQNWYKYVGLDGVAYGIDRYGASGPAAQVLDKFGFTKDNLVQAYKDAFN